MTAASDLVQILVVDDDRRFREFLRAALEQAGFRVREAEDGEQALAAAKAKEPNLVVLDVRLPRSSGYEILRELHDTVAADLPVILVSGELTDKEDLVGGLLLGAEDYVVKPFEPDELLARIRRSLRRGHPPAREPVNGDGSPLAGLTARELEVLELLAEGLTQVEIAARLVVSPRTVGTHIQHILSKLDVHSRAQAVALALRNGLDGREVTGHRSGAGAAA